MQKEISLNNKKVSYTVRKDRRTKRMRLAVHTDGTVVVSAPRWLPGYFIEMFIKDKSEWLLGNLEHFKKLVNVNSTHSC